MKECLNLLSFIVYIICLYKMYCVINELMSEFNKLKDKKLLDFVSI